MHNQGTTKQNLVYTTIQCPECKSHNIDIFESETGCEIPVLTLVIVCGDCAWSVHYYRDENCIPIGEELMKLLTEYSHFKDADIQSLIYDLVLRYIELDMIQVRGDNL